MARSCARHQFWLRWAFGWGWRASRAVAIELPSFRLWLEHPTAPGHRIRDANPKHATHRLQCPTGVGSLRARPGIRAQSTAGLPKLG